MSFLIVRCADVTCNPSLCSARCFFKGDNNTAVEQSVPYGFRPDRKITYGSSVAKGRDSGEIHMASSSVRRATVVSVGKLSDTIDKAISIAEERHNIGAESSNLLGPGRIIGRLIREPNVNAAFNAAVDITARVNALNGIEAVPAISKLGGRILMGF